MEIRFMVRFMILDWITCSYMQPTHRLCPDRRRPATSAGRSGSLRGRSIQWRFSPPTPRLPLVRGRSVAAEQNTTAIQVTVPTFLHVTPKYYYLRLVTPLIVCNLVWAQPGNLVWSEKCTAVTQMYSTAVP